RRPATALAACRAADTERDRKRPVAGMQGCGSRASLPCDVSNRINEGPSERQPYNVGIRECLRCLTQSVLYLIAPRDVPAVSRHCEAAIQKHGDSRECEGRLK